MTSVESTKTFPRHADVSVKTERIGDESQSVSAFKRGRGRPRKDSLQGGSTPVNSITNYFVKTEPPTIVNRTHEPMEE